MGATIGVFLLLVTGAVARLPDEDRQPYQLIGYWGQNLIKSQEPFNQTFWEGSLASFCQKKSYKIYHLSFMFQHFDVKKAPGIDFNHWCQWPTNKIPGWGEPNNPGFNLLNCSSIGQSIKTCQSLGKKVILSISPLDFISSTTGAVSANNVWDLFLGGKAPSGWIRPFGNDIVLDGVNLHIYNNHPYGYTSFVSTLRQLMDGDGSKTYYLSASPSCQFPDYVLNWPNTTDTDRALSTYPEHFDYIIMFAVNSPNICGWEINNEGFWKQIGIWNNYLAEKNPNLRLLVGLPSYPQWTNAAVGDYINVTDWMSKDIIEKMKTYSLFRGVALQDTSFDTWNLPCKGKTWTYSDVIDQVMKGESFDCSMIVANSTKTTSSTWSFTKKSDGLRIVLSFFFTMVVIVVLATLL